MAEGTARNPARSPARTKYEPNHQYCPIKIPKHGLEGFARVPGKSAGNQKYQHSQDGTNSLN
ncbi:hypothetical protein [Porphyrobacter sp. AAP82]|uniref:hypothetical protein n=1 Tax=Porphyrobacter sp. AAP82 TaxID=1248917 RepID=UPI0018C8C231|nr:hypothetical protein [Porphyrobacter sp. AAP82]